MKILALDTSTMMASCAVMEEDRLLGEYSLNQEESHSEKLVVMIKEMLDSLNLKVGDMDIYGVALGPGSFTGLRIGVSTIKAFAHLFDKPIVGVSTLEALAYNLPYKKIVVPMLDARRERVYTGIYSWEGSEMKTLMEADVLHIEDLIDRLKPYESLVVNGDGARVHQDILMNGLRDKLEFATMGSNFCRAASIGELALKKYRAGEMVDYYSLVPEYLRESQAQRELKEKE
ncbi:MAG: tRNA (adenosine(37)-N6)-threonylcarbamoyltransferase complex dimerization subunit type 1 TsaB [Tissierellaceae bacterium]